MFAVFRRAAGPAFTIAGSEWMLLAVAASAAAVLWQARGAMVSLQPGDLVEESITLVSADKHDLSCALERSIQGYHCEYLSPDRPRGTAGDPPANLAPYMTTDKVLYLIGGLFEQSEVEARYRAEPPAGKRREKLKRFTAYCQLRLLVKVEGFWTRWGRRSGWNRERSAWVARPLSCTTVR